MASISAGSFRDPRLNSQLGTTEVIDFGDAGPNRHRRCWFLYINPDADPAMRASRGHVNDQDDIEEYVYLPRKMVAALYHAAVSKGYLR